MQAVMHAVRDDLQHWKKIPEHTFFAQEDRYEKNDWRDPFVFSMSRPANIICCWLQGLIPAYPGVGD